MNRHRWVGLALVALVGCGGGLLDPDRDETEEPGDEEIVIAMRGQWVLDGDPDTAVLEDTSGERILRFTIDEASTYLTERSYTFRADFVSATGPCRGVIAVTGSADGERVEMRRADDNDTVCLDAELVDIRTLRDEDGRVYRSTAVNLELTQHEWEVEGDESRRLRFISGDPQGEGTDPNVDTPIVGCSRRGSGAAVAVSGTLQPFSAVNTSAPRVVGLRIGSTNYGVGEFRGASRIEFSGAPSLTLLRVPVASSPIDC